MYNPVYKEEVEVKHNHINRERKDRRCGSSLWLMGRSDRKQRPNLVRPSVVCLLECQMKLPNIDERLVDSQLYEPIPYKTALDDGCTHVLVIRSRPDGECLPLSPVEILMQGKCYGVYCVRQ